ncbi:MAG: oxidoreductase [Rhizobium sp.]|nr:MAG: oxidoreductase [Rhizobium sp.]
MSITNATEPGTLKGKVALVTGGGSGIGAAAAKRFATAGAKVVLAGRRRAELEAVAEIIRSLGGEALAVPTDVSDEAAVRRLIDGTLERFGRLDAAFNNAGILGQLKPITDLTASDFDEVMAVNLRAVWLLMKYEIAAMGESGGAIVNTTSFVAQASTPGMSIYAASKAGIEAMVRAAALEAGPRGIRVNNVAPGVIRTAMSAGLDDALYDALAANAALKRLGEPEDVGDVAVWLCSNEARFITGQTIFVDGGFAIPGLR